jgi:membrane fusion protein (multidrug efflux system)
VIKKAFGFPLILWSTSVTSLQTSIAQAPPNVTRFLKRGLIALVLLLTAVATAKWVLVTLEVRRRAAELEAGPQVKIARVVQSPGDHVINLIGETRPYAEATLYAKVSGYLKTVKVDKGDKVKQGQVLAVIESAETDQAYEAAVSDWKNKQNINLRMSALRAKGLVSQQEMEQALADAQVAEAKYRGEATLKGYEVLRAPFNGTVTSRFADPGALVQNAMTSQSSALPVVTVSTVDHLRLDLFVDQHDAPYVEKDEGVEVTQTDRPGFKMIGKVARISEELDPRTKMLLTEVELPNDEKQLVAGSFVQVALRVKSPPFLQAPVESLLMKDDKLFLTVVTPDNKMSYKSVEIANNDGKLLWIVSGVNMNDRVALNVGDTVPEGGKVRPLPEAAKELKP